MKFHLKKVKINKKRLKSVEICWKTIKKVKNQPKKDKFQVPPQGVDKLLYVDQLWGVDKDTYFFLFIFSDFSRLFGLLRNIFDIENIIGHICQHRVRLASAAAAAREGDFDDKK